MPDEKNRIQTIIEFLVDKQTLNKGKKAFDELKKKNSELKRETRSQIDSLRDVGKSYADMGKAGVRSLKSIGNEYKKLEKMDKDLEIRLKQRDDQFDDLSRNVGLAGDFQSNLGAIQGLLGQAGATQASQSLATLGEFGVLVEELPRLKLALEGMPDAMRAMTNAIGGKQLGAIGAIGLLSTAIILLQNEASKRTEDFRRELAVGRSARELATQLTTEELQERRDAQQEIVDLTRKELDRLKGAYGDFNQAVVDEFGVLGAGIAKVNSALGTNNTEFRAMEQDLGELETQLKDAESELRTFNIALDDTAVQANNARKAALESDQNLIGTAQRLADQRRQELQFMDSSVEQNKERLETLREEQKTLEIHITNLKNSSEGTEVVTKELERLRQQYEDNKDAIGFLIGAAIPATQAIKDQADAEKQLEESSKKRLQQSKEFEGELKKQGQFAKQAADAIKRFTERENQFNRTRAENLEDFNRDRVQAEEDLNNKLLQISRNGTARLDKLNQSIGDLNQEYFQSSINAQRDYADELKQVDEERNLARVQRERQGAQKLDEIAQDNNVIAFLREQARQREERRQDQENSSLEDRQRADQFQRQQDDARQAFLQRRELLQRQVAEERKAIQQRIDDERKAFEIAEGRAKEQFELEQGRAQQTLDLERQKTQEQLRLIFQKAQAEANAISGTTAQVRQLQSAVNALRATVSSFSSTASQSLTQTSSVFQKFGGTLTTTGKPSEQFNKGFAFARGGIVSRPTPAILGEQRGFNEAVIPFRPSEGIRPALKRLGLAGGGVTNLTINAMVGENASVSEVRGLINEAVRTSELKMVRGVASGITQSRFNAQAS